MPDLCKLLFICTRNRFRSLTAEHLYRGFPGYLAKSAGTSPSARVRVTEKHIRWADLIIVMEKKHAQQLTQRFGEILMGTEIVCLRIPDEYEYNDPELIQALKAALADYVDVPE